MRCCASLPSSQNTLFDPTPRATILPVESGHRTTIKYPATQAGALAGRPFLPSWVNRKFAPSPLSPHHVKSSHGSAALSRPVAMTPVPNGMLDQCAWNAEPASSYHTLPAEPNFLRLQLRKPQTHNDTIMTGNERGHDTRSRKQGEAVAAATAAEQTRSHGSSSGSSSVRFALPIKRARAHTRSAMVPRSISERHPRWMKKVGIALEIAVTNLVEGLSSRWPVDSITFLPTGRVSVHLRETDYADFGNDYSQSKLSQQELVDLQKATHFDKKELQQWYKGELLFIPQNVPIRADFEFVRFSEGLSLGQAQQRRVSTHLQAILPLRRPVYLCRVRIQRLRRG